MRKVQALVVAQTVVLGVLSLLWSQRGDVAPPTRETATNAAGPGGSAAAAGSNAVQPPAASERTAERHAAPMPAGGGSVAVVLQGRLRGVEPPPKGTAIRLSCRRDDQWQPATVSDDGQYAIAGLQPGTWRIACDADGCRKLELDHTLTDAPIQRLDLVLEPATVLSVHVHTSSGARLAAELAKAGTWLRLRVVATAEPLAGDFAPSQFTEVGDLGVGRHRRSWDMNQLAEPNGDEGTLELDQPPPVHAALLLRHVVLAQQRIEPGQRELHFTVDVDAVRGKQATVRLRLLDPNGQPLGKVMVTLDLARQQMGVTAEDGTVVLKDVMPGLAHLNVQAASREPYATSLVVAAGASLDLGDLVLHPAVKIQGRVVDADGTPVGATIRWTNLDVWQPPLPMLERQIMAADGDGNFQLAIGPHRYVVQASTGDGRLGLGVIDGRTAATTPFPITVQKSTQVHFVASGPPTSTYRIVVRNGEGHPVAVRSLEPQMREHWANLPAGDYSLELYVGERTLLRRQALTVGTTRLRVEVP